MVLAPLEYLLLHSSSFSTRSQQFFLKIWESRNMKCEFSLIIQSLIKGDYAYIKSTHFKWLLTAAQGQLIFTKEPGEWKKATLNPAPFGSMCTLLS